MRLITRIVLIFIVVTTVVFIIGGFLSLRIFSNEVKKEEQWFLLERLKSTERYIKKRMPTERIIRDKVIIIPMEDSILTDQVVFSDTVVYHSTLDRPELHNKLEVGKKFDDIFYKIILFDIIIEQDDIVDGVVESLLILYIILIMLILFFSWVFSKRLLKPFEATLSAIKNYDIKEIGEPSLKDTKTIEFQRLNVFIKNMTRKVRADYSSLKEFTENASHEIQTPISIVKGKLDLLTETELNPEQKKLVSDAGKNLQTLSKLSNSLTLLAKIDNEEFSKNEYLRLDIALLQTVKDYNELIHLKGIDLQYHIEDKVEWKFNDNLFNLMFTNLLNNAVKHNINNRPFIKIFLTEDNLVISNSGPELTTNPNNLFQRFKKADQSSSSLGLGLAIIKRIVDYYDYHINYFYEEGIHTISISRTWIY